MREYKNYTLFPTKDRIRLIYEAMIQDQANGGGELPLQLMFNSLSHPLISGTFLAPPACLPIHC